MGQRRLQGDIAMGFFSSRKAPVTLQDAPILGGAVEREPVAAMVPQGGGFFGENGAARPIAGYIGDALLRLSGGQPIYQPLMQQRQQQDREEAIWNRRQQAQQKQALDLYDYKRTHPEEDEFSVQLRAAGIDPTSPEGQQMRREKLQNSIDPARMMEINGRPTLIGGKWGYPGQSQGFVPSAPVGDLKPYGGPPASPVGGFPAVTGAPGRMTSGRRTVAGNRAVGGVPNSYHINGDAADYVGTSIDALRRYYGPGVKIIPESDHLHVQARGLNAPLFGKRGTI
jgi:hypothetical protein